MDAHPEEEDEGECVPLADGLTELLRLAEADTEGVPPKEVLALGVERALREL